MRTVLRAACGIALVGGKVIGAIGMSGDTPQVDEDIAIAGANAFR
jgi:uncharacterized protein GlcG (DUF336 family)